MAETDTRLARSLLAWYGRNKRDLPWRRTRDPYRIWVSEIMLQQTRVAAVIPYYERFLAELPDLTALAECSEPKLLELWAGLGYYRRARLLQAAARTIVEQHGSAFPESHDQIRALEGIGDYTAAAVASIAFEQPRAALDGNVARVLARLDAERGEASSTRVRKALQARAQHLIERVGADERGDFNQATMELGATVCLPKSPHCNRCPWMKACRGFREGIAEKLPVKRPKGRTERLELSVALVRRGGSLLMRRRPDHEEITPGFWELPQAIGARLDIDCLQPLGIRLGEKLGEFKHAITFRSFACAVYEAILESPRPEEYRWVSLRRRSELPLTTITKKALLVAS